MSFSCRWNRGALGGHHTHLAEKRLRTVFRAKNGGPKSLNQHTYAERFVRTIKESCLDRMIFFGEDSLRRAITEFARYYHHERNHQGLENRLIDPLTEVGSADGAVACRERLGGMLRYYYRAAA